MTMTVIRAVGVANTVEARNDTPAELHVCRTHARVDDVRAHARAAIRIGVQAIERQIPLVDAVDAPRHGRQLRVGRNDHRVGFDRDHVRVGRKCVV